MITLRQLFSVCLFGHGDQIFDRDQGVLVFRCLACGQISHTPDLSKDSHQGIAHQRPVILGEPKTTVHRGLKVRFMAGRPSQRS